MIKIEEIQNRIDYLNKRLDIHTDIMCNIAERLNLLLKTLGYEMHKKPEQFVINKIKNK